MKSSRFPTGAPARRQRPPARPRARRRPRIAIPRHTAHHHVAVRQHAPGQYNVGGVEPNNAAATASASQPWRTASHSATARARRAFTALSPRRTATRPPRLARRAIITTLRAGTTESRPVCSYQSHPNACRVIAAVQRPHPRLQRCTIHGCGQRIAVGLHHDQHTTRANPKPTVPIGTQRRPPNRATFGCGPRTTLASKRRNSSARWRRSTTDHSPRSPPPLRSP